MANKEKRSQTIRNRLVALLLFMSFITINYFVMINYYDGTLHEIQYVVDISNKNAAHAYEIALHAQYMKQGDDQRRVALRQAIEAHEAGLVILRKGSPKTSKAPAAVSSSIDITERLWYKYRQKADILVNEPLMLENREMNPQVEDAANYILKNVENMVEQDRALTAAYIAYYENFQDTRTFSLWAILVANLLLLALGFTYINFNIVRPISKISRINEIVSSGDFRQRIRYDADDELGRVAIAINALFENLEKATDFILAIGEGKLDIEYKLSGENGQEVKQDRLTTALIDMRNKMSVVAEQDRQRSWVSEGLATFADILRKDIDDDDFNYRIIANLVKYLEANQGAIFIINDDNEAETYLEMVATYAYGKKKFVERKIEKGEGLVGEVYQEGQTVYIREVPQSYISITSGLGDATPSSLLIVPLKINNEVYGVVELASFEPFHTYQIEFVEKLSESIATTFSSVKTNVRTQKLLFESVQLSEQMRAQEEEMRQNLEELVSTQEEVERKNQLIEEQKAELQKQLDEQTQLIVDLRNREAELREELQRQQEERSLLEKALTEQQDQQSDVHQQLQDKDEQVRRSVEEFDKIKAELAQRVQQLEQQIQLEQKNKKQLEERIRHYEDSAKTLQETLQKVQNGENSKVKEILDNQKQTVERLIANYRQREEKYSKQIAEKEVEVSENKQMVESERDRALILLEGQKTAMIKVSMRLAEDIERLRQEVAEKDRIIAQLKQSL